MCSVVGAWVPLRAIIGFAIVFVQHLDPNHHSLLAETPERVIAQK
jgi:hypothetical protein